MRLRLLVITAMLAVPSMGSADEPGWVAIGQGESFTEYVDVNSLRIRAGRLTASTLTDFAAPQQSNEASAKPYRSMTTLRMYDCSADRAGALVITFYAEAVGQGNVLKTITIKPAAVVMNHSSPESLGHIEIETVCSMWANTSRGVNAAAKR
jgi:hypothetical protein